MNRLPGVAVLATGLWGCTGGSGAPSPANLDASIGVSVCSSDAGTVPPSCPADGGTCAIAAGQDTPWAIALDSAHVYWTTLAKGSAAGSATGGTVVVAPLSGGSETTIASGLSVPNALATDGTNVYWANSTDGTVLRADVTVGGPPTTLASGLGSSNSIVVGADGVYVNPDGNVVRVAFDGGAAQVVAADAGAGAIAVDPSTVYWGSLEGDGGALFSAPLDGGTPKLRALLPYFPVTIVVDGTTIYWSVFNGFVMSMARDAGTPTTIASGLNAAYGVAVDSTYIYWTTQDAVMKAPKGGGAATIVAASSATAFVAVNAAGMYWTTAQIAPCATDPSTAGAVMRTPLSP